MLLKLCLITDNNGALMVGSEFVPGFKSIIDFFLSEGITPAALNKLKHCFPRGCASIAITGAEEVLVLMILLGDIDGNCANLGLVPSKDKEGSFEVAKIDHDEAGGVMVSSMTLRSMAKMVFGEGKSYFTEFDYEKFDLDKMADIFDIIADVPDEVWGDTILNRGQELISAGCEARATEWESMAALMNQRKEKCRDFALGLRCEAAVRSNNFSAIQKLIDAGFDPNTPVDYIHIDSTQEKQILSLVKLGHYAYTDPKALDYFIKYSQQNGPISILELAARYKKLDLVKQLLPLSTEQSRQKAIEAVRELRQNAEL